MDCHLVDVLISSHLHVNSRVRIHVILSSYVNRWTKQTDSTNFPHFYFKAFPLHSVVSVTIFICHSSTGLRTCPFSYDCSVRFYFRCSHVLLWVSVCCWCENKHFMKCNCIMIKQGLCTLRKMYFNSTSGENRNLVRFTHRKLSITRPVWLWPGFYQMPSIGTWGAT